MRCHPAVLAFLPFLLLACELTEVVVAPGRRTVVVHSVISRNNPRQFVVVEYSQVGDNRSPSATPFGGVREPIRGASVTVEHLSPGPCIGRTDAFAERAPSDSLFAPGLYAGSLCGAEPGERLRLRVETPAGEVVTGVTTVPGASAREVTVAGRPARFSMDTLALHRERDTLRVGVTPLSGRALQLEAGRGDFAGDLSLYLITDSMGVAIAADFRDPLRDGQHLFRAGRYYLFTVAVTDTNYFDFVRSRSDPFTGRGFINRLDGGIGVFGSVEAGTHVLRVEADVDDPREGIYRVTGTARGVSLDITLEAYLENVQRGSASAFVRGDWLDGPVNLSGEAAFGGFFSEVQLNDPNGFLFSFLLPQPGSYPRRYTLHGIRPADGSPFSVELWEYGVGGREPFKATLTAQQIQGPSQ